MAISLAPGMVLVAGRSAVRTSRSGLAPSLSQNATSSKMADGHGEPANSPVVGSLDHDDNIVVQLDLIGSFHGYHGGKRVDGVEDAGNVVKDYLCLIPVTGKDENGGSLTGV